MHEHIFVTRVQVCLFTVNERHAVSKAGFSERKSCHKQMHKNWFEEEGLVASE
jgi:hypothetical protein